jgi:uncharacterized repeat protein (TIGR03803 family)
MNNTKIMVILIGCFFTLLLRAEYSATILYSFDGTNGALPYNALIQGKDGNFYGTTSAGGIDFNKGPDHGNGVIFKMSPSGRVTNLFMFSGTNGAFNPTLTEGTDGYFYGTTFRGGKNDRGTIFKISGKGKFESLFSFDDLTGKNPEARLIQAKDGNFYGTCGQSGKYGHGTIFRITTGGNFQLIYSFGEQPDLGLHPDGGTPLTLVEAKDGNFYGITIEGGGTIFRVTPKGKLTTLFYFGGTNGSLPNYFFSGKDGNLYGAAVFGGKYNCGVIFKIATNGVYSVLSHLNKEEMDIPPSLFQDLNGDLIFYTRSGGKLVKLTSDGKQITIHEGLPLFGKAFKDSKGELYCTSALGGTYGHGVIIRLR